MSQSVQKLGDDFPQLCETCLGSNPYVRMVKLPPAHKLCKISNLPYAAFRWKAGPQGRYKETVISYVVAQEKNICQCCLNDMRYGVPVGVRDAIIDTKVENAVVAPKSIVGTMFYYENKARELQEQAKEGGGDDSQSLLPWADESEVFDPNHRQLAMFSQSLHQPYSNQPQSGTSNPHNQQAFRNLAKLCTFWLNGACTRVARKACPFRPCNNTFLFPELAGTNREINNALIARLQVEGPDKVQRTLDAETRKALHQALKVNRDDSIKKRVLGEDDLSRKYVNKIKNMNPEISAPVDTSMKTLYFGNLDVDVVDENMLQTLLFSSGQMISIHISRPTQCAFVEYIDRPTAERAVQLLHNNLEINGRKISVNWAKNRSTIDSSSNSDHRPPPPPLPPMQALPGSEQALKKRRIVPEQNEPRPNLSIYKHV